MKAPAVFKGIAVIAAAFAVTPAFADAPPALERAVVRVAPSPGARPTSAPATAPSTAPSTVPTTDPAAAPATTTTASTSTTASTQPVDKPFPRDFAILLTRSPFVRGTPGAAAAPASPEATFGLRGVGLLDGKFIAMVENIAAKGVQQLKEGDSVAFGKVKSITLDGMVYEANGKSTPVAIGQNLLGAALPPLPPPPPPPAQPQEQPGQPGPPGQPQPGQPGGPPPGARVRRG